MSQRASAILWLVMALFCGLLTLATCGGGGYGIWEVQDKLKVLDERIADDDKLREDPKVNQNEIKDAEVLKRLHETINERNEYEHYRLYAIAGAGVSLVPGLMTLAFLAMAWLRFMKKKRPARTVDEEAGEEEEETAAEEPVPLPKPND